MAGTDTLLDQESSGGPTPTGWERPLEALLGAGDASVCPADLQDARSAVGRESFSQGYSGFFENRGESPGRRTDDDKGLGLPYIYEGCSVRFAGRTKEAFSPEAGPNCPDVTVVVPVYNGLDHLERLLPALLKHTSESVRLLFVDDASPDPQVGLFWNKRWLAAPTR